MKVSDINANIIAQFESTLGQSVPIFPKAFLRVLAKVLAGVYVTLYKYAEWMMLQLFPSTASFSDTVIQGNSINPLKEWGRLVGCGEPYAATASRVQVRLTALSGSATVPIGTEFVDPNTNLSYRLLDTIVFDEPTEEALLECTTLGSVSALASGALLTCSDPPPGLYPIAEVESSAPGADAETEASYRQRVINYYARRPSGGSYADYYRWGMEAENVADIYPYTGVNPGEVDVYVRSATHADGIPDAAMLAAVAVEINRADRKPVNVLVNVLPITRKIFTVNVYGLLSDRLAEAKIDITAAIVAHFASMEPYINGLSYGARNDAVTASTVAAVVQSVVQQYAGSFGTVIMYSGGDPLDAYSLDAGELAKCTTVTYV